MPIPVKGPYGKARAQRWVGFGPHGIKEKKIPTQPSKVKKIVGDLGKMIGLGYLGIPGILGKCSKAWFR